MWPRITMLEQEAFWQCTPRVRKEEKRTKAGKETLGPDWKL